MRVTKQFREIAARMLTASGPWLNCPFCVGVEPARAWGPEYVPHDEDPTQYHQPGCLLRKVVDDASLR